MWKTQLVIFTALEDGKVKADTQDYVRRYLDIHEVEAEYILDAGDAMDRLKKVVEEQGADLVLMGSHSGNVLQQVLLGSAVDTMLRESTVPTFICR
jgi:nucleotide-binding universal stress UspA family protein